MTLSVRLDCLALSKWIAETLSLFMRIEYMLSKGENQKREGLK